MKKYVKVAYTQNGIATILENTERVKQVLDLKHLKSLGNTPKLYRTSEEIQIKCNLKRQEERKIKEKELFKSLSTKKELYSFAFYTNNILDSLMK